MIYLYNYSGEPWKAQRHVRNVMRKLYNATENGYLGDEDQGQTSSWYVLSAMWFYSVCRGTNEYVIGSPVFKKTTITLEDGKKFVIQADDNDSANVYIQSAALNGKNFTKNFLTYGDITNGGLLHFKMGVRAALQRGLSPADKPFSFQAINSSTPVIFDSKCSVERKLLQQRKGNDLEIIEVYVYHHNSFIFKNLK
jgi:putative alpha-1,2-mannosidase